MSRLNYKRKKKMTSKNLNNNNNKTKKKKALKNINKLRKNIIRRIQITIQITKNNIVSPTTVYILYYLAGSKKFNEEDINKNYNQKVHYKNENKPPYQKYKKKQTKEE